MSKKPNPVEALRQSLKEKMLIREGKLHKRDIHKFLERLEKEIQEDIKSSEVVGDKRCK